jgi:hypothetical protein
VATRIDLRLSPARPVRAAVRIGARPRARSRRIYRCRIDLRTVPPCYTTTLSVHSTHGTRASGRKGTAYSAVPPCSTSSQAAVRLPTAGNSLRDRYAESGAPLTDVTTACGLVGAFGPAAAGPAMFGLAYGFYRWMFTKTTYSDPSFSACVARHCLSLSLSLSC